MPALRILHFADAHIDIANHGRQDPQTGLPRRVLDFLTALDTIIDTAITEKVDLVLFAGDTYKDRTPAPTFQREWGRRIMRLSRAQIPTFLLVGNHDISPATGRAHALQEYDTLQIPYVRVVARPTFLGPNELYNLPLQILCLPWVSRSGMLATLSEEHLTPNQIYTAIEDRISNLLEGWLQNLNPDLPALLTAHASIQGAQYGGERTVMLGNDLVLPLSVVCDRRLSYTALGHIHKAQNLNPDSSPPVIYPGSIERVDFGEAADDKFFVIAHITSGQPTRVEWRKLEGRTFLDYKVTITSDENVPQQCLQALPPAEKLRNAIVRLTITYPKALEPLLDEPGLRRYAAEALEFHLIRRPQIESRLRLPADSTISSLTPLDLLNLYLDTHKTAGVDATELQKLASQIMSETNVS
jgi:exonuclease SbcD